MGYKKSDPCLNNAFNDERLFVLMTRDLTSPKIVGEWIKENIGIQPREKLIEALDCAIEMFNRQYEISKRKTILKENGFISVDHNLPSPESTCEVIFEDYSTGILTYWNDIEGWDAQSEPHHLMVIGFKNAKRAT